MRTERPAGLLPFLAGALLLHGVVGLLWHAPPKPAESDKPRIHAALRPAETRLVVPIPASQAPASKPVDATPQPRAASPLGLPETPARTDIPATPAPLAGKLLTEAKAMLNRESRQRQLDPMFAPPGKAAAADSPLARAAARPVAGEKMLGDGVLQLTTADGKVHCLQKPSDIASRDIPGGSFAIPVTCPF